MYLDDVPDLECEVAYGQLGRRGDLGYEGKAVVVRGKRFAHALSAHAPSWLKVRLDRRFKGFAAEVALTDDIPAGASWADFLFCVDGRLCAIANHVHSGDPPRRVEVSVEGAHELELIAETSRWEHCHSVWLDPVLKEEGYHRTEQTILDPLERAEISLVTPLPWADSCVATVASAGFERLLEEMLASLAVHGGCPNSLLVVFAVDAGTECERIAKAHGAHVVRCRTRAAINSTIKSVLYSVARIIDARKFVCLDADMLVMGGLAPLFAALEVAPPDSILACREANGHGLRDLNQTIHAVYGGRPRDLHRIMNGANGEGNFDLPVNDGLFAGSRGALLALDGLLRRWPSAIAWVDERRDIWWRNQFVFNLALARLRCAVELDPVFNIQLNSQDVALSGDRETAMSAHWHGQRVRVLHFNGGGRKKYAQWRAEFHSRARTSLSGIPNNCGRSPELPLSGLTGQAPIIQSACDGQL